MANIMTKKGSLDNIVTYEHYCDTILDLANIPANEISLGSTAIVLQGENGTLEVYIANSQKHWAPLLNEEGGLSMSNITHICSQEEYNSTTKVPTVEDPEENIFYLVPSGENTNDLFEEWIYVDNKWEHFGAGGSIEVPQADWNENDPTSLSYIKNKPGAAEGVSF